MLLFLSILIIVFRGYLRVAWSRPSTLSILIIVFPWWIWAIIGGLLAIFQFLLLYSFTISKRASKRYCDPFNSYYCIRKRGVSRCNCLLVCDFQFLLLYSLLPLLPSTTFSSGSFNSYYCIQRYFNWRGCGGLGRHFQFLLLYSISLWKYYTLWLTWSFNSYYCILTSELLPRMYSQKISFNSYYCIHTRRFWICNWQERTFQFLLLYSS